MHRSGSRSWILRFMITVGIGYLAHPFNLPENHALLQEERLSLDAEGRIDWSTCHLLERFAIVCDAFPVRIPVLASRALRRDRATELREVHRGRAGRSACSTEVWLRVRLRAVRCPTPTRSDWNASVLGLRVAHSDIGRIRRISHHGLDGRLWSRGPGPWLGRSSWLGGSRPVADCLGAVSARISFR